MAQLKDLIVYGDAKFLGDVTLDHDPTAALHAATKAYVDSQVGTGTDEKLKVAALTSGTEYLPILAVSSDSGAAATRQIDKNAQALKYICTPGTSGGTSGTAQLVLGNSINGGYANSATGVLTLYGASIYGVDIKYNGAYLNQTLLIPGPTASDQTNYFVTKVGSTSIGAADQPVYIDSSGHAVVANKNLWGFSSNHGIFYPNDVSTTGNTFGDGSLTILGYDIKNLTGIRSSMSSLNMLADGRQNLSASTAAGSTTYVLASTQDIGANGSNIIAANTYYYSTDGLVAQKPTSVDNNGSTLTFASTLNPNSAISKISFANYDSSGMSILCGAGLTNTAACNLLVGLKIYTTGYYNLAVGSLNYTGGTGSAVTGIRNYVNANYTLTTGYGNTNVKDGAFVSGVWHDTTNGPSYLAAVGKYSNITSTSAFVVGNGTGTDARANAFEVHTDGRATVGADPTANLDVATKQYVDGLISTWKLTSQGGLISQPDVIAGDTVGRGVVVIASRSTLQSSMIPELWKSSTDVGSNLMIPAPNYIDLNASAPAGSTTYTIRALPRTPDGTANHLLDILFGIDSSVSAQKPTSISFDSNGFPILTFATSLNPNEAASRIYAGVELTEDTDASITVGNGVFNSGMSTVITGTLIKNTNNYCIATGQNINNSGAIVLVNGARAKNTGSYVLLSGSDLLNTSSNYSALIGQGHYNTSGPAALAAVGKYSSITSTTQFVVGNGTSASARSNAFEVTTTGEAKAVSFTENGTSLVDKYAVKTHTHGDLSSTGIITTNPGVVIASGDALLIADSSVGNALKKTSITFGTSTTTYLRNDGTWGTPPASSDTKVTQTAVTGTGTTSRYPILLTYSASQTATATNTANFTANASITPAGDIYGSTFHYGPNAYTQYNSTLKAIEFCFA